jgi:hypothetical protein
MSCILAAFEVNSEPHTGASFSIRVRVGPELARYVHLKITFVGQPVSVIHKSYLAYLPAQWHLMAFSAYSK